MSEEKPKTATEQALDNAKAELKEKLEQISVLKEELKTSKDLLKNSKADLKNTEKTIEKITKWASDFGSNPDAEYKGSFIDTEIKKVLSKENQNVRD